MMPDTIVHVRFARRLDAGDRAGGSDQTDGGFDVVAVLGQGRRSQNTPSAPPPTVRAGCAALSSLPVVTRVLLAARYRDRGRIECRPTAACRGQTPPLLMSLRTG
jgi:hypothetical protein